MFRDRILSQAMKWLYVWHNALNRVGGVCGVIGENDSFFDHGAKRHVISIRKLSSEDV